MVPVAHSPKGDVPAQAYQEHIENVSRQAVTNAKHATTHYTGDSAVFIDTVEAAAMYHDLGKLDEANQEVLRRQSYDPLHVAHEDAGVAELLKLRRRESAVLVAAHHVGLFSQEVEMDREMSERGRAFRNPKVANHVDQQLETYVAAHSIAGCPTPGWIDGGQLHKCGFTRRMALSCLVDADHSDTARHYGNEIPYDPPEPRWQERLGALDQYVAYLPAGDTDRERHRNHLRRQMYHACRAAEIEPPIRSCDAPVGSGKTTAVMAYLLQAAQKKDLRHIFVVLPYTNIIKQSVEVYRQALVLPGERPEDLVAEHHHQADFEDVSLRQLATLWRAPVIVTTAVQFFETLASHHPARLRKLHELPSSAVFVDETHAAIPSHLWPQVWHWLETWTRDWGGHIVLASGSLPRFWELTEFVDPPKNREDVPDLVPDTLRNDLEQAEKRRVSPQRHKEPLDCDGLITWVSEAKGPRLVILNTVQSAAVVADRMRKAGHDVLHLSTALAPIHRNRIVDRIKERLIYGYEDWTLVATSCVEAGMNFSFRTGFRESCSTSSVIQIGGRVSRDAEHAEAVVWDFRVRDAMLSQHPGFTVPRRVLDQMFDDMLVQTWSPSELAKEAMRREVTAGEEDRAQEICKAEDGMEYPKVAQLCRVIDSDTRLVVIDADVVKALRQRERVGYRQLLLHSVQIWADKVAKLPIVPIFSSRTGKDDSSTLYAWTEATDAYDPDFLGYMAGVIPLLEGLLAGCFLG
jgi:CRISPR-associated endonuclease/helicase Cas3